MELAGCISLVSAPVHRIYLEIGKGEEKALTSTTISARNIISIHHEKAATGVESLLGNAADGARPYGGGRLRLPAGRFRESRWGCRPREDL